MATEFLNNIAILPQKRQESYFYVSLLREQKDFLREIMEKIEPLVF